MLAQIRANITTAAGTGEAAAIISAPSVWSLPFTDAAARNLWTPARSGDYTADNEIGREYARELVEFLQRGGAPSALAHICAAMGETSAVEVGFFQFLAQRVR